MNGTDEFVAFSSRWRIGLLILVALAFVVVGLWMAGVFGPPPESRRYSPERVTTVGRVSIIFFGLCGMAAFKMLFDRREQLRIGASGIRWVRWSDQTIPWSEIVDITVWQHSSQKCLILHLRDASRFPGRGLQGFLAGPNRALTGGDLSITLTGTDRSFGEAMEAIHRFRV